MPEILTPEDIAEIRRIAHTERPSNLSLESLAGKIFAHVGSLPFLRHPLGFVCLPAHRGAEEGVCIHIWSRDIHLPPPTTSPYHSHSWDLRSYVLRGRLTHCPVTIERNSASPTHQVFTVRSVGAKDILAPTGEMVSVVKNASEVMSAGRLYALPAGHYHCTEVSGDAVTLVLARHTQGPEYTLGGLAVTSHSVTRIACTDAERESAMSLIARVIPLMPNGRNGSGHD